MWSSIRGNCTNRCSWKCEHAVGLCTQWGRLLAQSLRPRGQRQITVPGDKAKSCPWGQHIFLCPQTRYRLPCPQGQSRRQRSKSLGRHNVFSHAAMPLATRVGSGLANSACLWHSRSHYCVPSMQARFLLPSLHSFTVPNRSANGCPHKLTGSHFCFASFVANLPPSSQYVAPPQQ